MAIFSGGRALGRPHGTSHPHSWRLLLLNKDLLMDQSELQSLTLVSETGRGRPLSSRPNPQSGKLWQGLHLSEPQGPPL